MSSLFISDLHLSEKRPHITEAFFSFLTQQAQVAERLYILGDLFDAWIGDDDDSQFARSVLHALKDYSLSGKQLFFMAGNRDFLVGSTFETLTGATLLPDPCIITLTSTEYGDSALLMHGDSLCTEDNAYQEFRSMVRHPSWRETVLAKPLSERRQLAKMLRDESQQANADKNMSIMDVTEAEVLQVMQQQQQHLLIHGHTHRPAVHEIPEINAQRIVLGDWHTQGWYLLVDENGLQLESFDL